MDRRPPSREADRKPERLAQSPGETGACNLHRRKQEEKTRETVALQQEGSNPVAENKQPDSSNKGTDLAGDPEAHVWSRLQELWAQVQEEGLVPTLVREAGGAFIVRVVGAGVAFGAQVLLARWMGVRSYGVFTFVWTWVTVLVLFGRLGVDKALIRYVPGYQEDQRWEKLRGLLQFGGRLVGAVCVGLSVVGAVVVWWFRGGMPEG